MENAGGFLLSKDGMLAVGTGVFTILSLVLFVREFYKGKNRPYMWSWVIRLGICVVAFAGQMNQGATYSLALTFSQIICCLSIIGLVAYAKSSRGKLDSIDWLGLGLALLGVFLWVISGSAVFSIVGVLLADSCATTIGIRAAITKGNRESIAFWACAFIAASLALAAAKGGAWTLLALPLFSCVNALANIVTAVYVGKHGRRSVAANAKELSNQPESVR